MSRKILITGGAGNVAGSLACKLVEDPRNYVVIVDDLSTGHKKNLPPAEAENWKFIRADVNNYQEIAPIMTSDPFDYVFHYAALVGVKRTLANPVGVMTDIQGIKYMLELSKNTGVKRFFYSSSSEVYGDPVEIPQHEETTPMNARLPYAVVKLTGETYIKAFHQYYGLNYTIFRFFNTYGPRQSQDFVMPRFVHAALEGRDIPIYGDGGQTRTFCYIDDNLEATVKCLNEDLYVNDVINLGSDRELSVLELAELIIKLTNSTSKIKHLPALKEGDMLRRCPDNSRMRELLGRDVLPLEKGIMKLVESTSHAKIEI